nr:nuclear pore membrane glycoprotein 210 isoform X1 [Onthophagus taurus]
MAGKLSFLLRKLLLVVLLTNAVITSKLNAPHVLLPIFENVDVTFQLEAVSGGCYKWSTSRSDVILLTLVDPSPLDCSSKVIISSVLKDPVRNVAVVLAEEVETQLILRADVIVDVIDKLGIVTTTKEIILEEIPEVFKVVAYDSQGNQFTSLQGVEFDWKIVNLGSNQDVTILNFIPFGESSYDTIDWIEEFEDQNKRGDVVLVGGVKTGAAKLVASLPYDDYADLEEVEVILAVIANLIIMPTDAHVMPFDTVYFKLYSVNNGQMEEVELPDSQYFMDIESPEIASVDPKTGLISLQLTLMIQLIRLLTYNNGQMEEVELLDSQYFMDIESPEIASVDPKTGEVTGLAEGRTKVKLRDSTAEDIEQQKLPSAFINVCMPSYIKLSILPFRNWAILMNFPHVLLAEVYSSTDHKLDLGPGVELQIQLDEKFQLVERSPNGTWLFGWGQAPGRSTVVATLDAIVNDKLGRKEIGPISTKQEMKIFPSIIINPSDVVLPWDPVAQPRYQVPLTARGGDGKYLWVCSNNSIAVVTQNGMVKTHADGFFEVSAVMQINPNNRESAKFYIVPPTKLEIIEYITEAEIDTNIYIHIAIYGEKPDADNNPVQIPFTNCQDLPFKIDSADPHFLIDTNKTMETIGVSCANFAVNSSVVGSSKISVSYNIGGKYLQDSVVVSTYKPLTMIFPETPIVLAVGTTIQLIFTGGPAMMHGREIQYLKGIITENSDIVEAADITEKMELPPSEEEFTVVGVFCKALGESMVNLTIFDAPTVVNTHSIDCQMDVLIICGKPRTLKIQPELNTDNVHSCPMDLSADKALIQSDHDTELDIAVMNENGLRFLNITTLRFEWSADPPEFAVLHSMDSVIPRDIFNGTLNFGNKSYQIVTPKTTSGTIVVNAKVVGYDKIMLAKVKVTPEWPEFLDDSEKDAELPPIETSVSLLLVDDTQVVPTDVTLYNHPSSTATVSVNYGSGYYEMVLSTPDVADVVYLSHKRQLEITPRNDGELKIELHDLCLAGTPPVVNVHVVSVSMIRVDVADKVELSKFIPCTVKLYDSSDNLLKVPVDMIGIHIDQDPDLANFNRLTPDILDPWPDGNIKYTIQGEKVGNTKIKFSISTSVIPIESSVIDLQIFDHLKLLPKNLTTIIGTNVQIMHDGGPGTTPTMEFTLEETKIGEVTSSGILSALHLGSTKVTGMCVGVDPSSGEKVIYAQDTAEVHVIPIQGFQIKAALTRFRLKSEVPIWVSGIPEQITPMILGTASPDYIYEWFVEDPDIIRIVSVFEPLGITYDAGDLISIRIRGLRPGKTKLTLNVTVPGNVVQSKMKTVTFTETMDFDVFEELALMSPPGFSGKALLMAPNSSIQLMTNADSNSRCSYKLIGDDQSIVTVTSQGMLKSEDQLGYAMVLITSIDNHGLKQTLSLIVEVKPIVFMRLSVIADWTMQTSEFNNIVPLGTEFQLRATYHDNTGNGFSAGTAKLRIRNSRPDLTTVKLGGDNATLLVSIVKPGITILKVSAEGIQKSADYIKLHVGQAIVPRVTSLVVGDIVCMWTPVNAAAPGVWTSSDEQLFSIDSETGVGAVVPTRNSGKIYLTHNLHPVAPLQMQIVPVNSLVCVSDEKPTISNSANNRPLEIPVIVGGEGTNRKSNLLNAASCGELDVSSIIKEYPFECEIEFSNRDIQMEISSIFRVETIFNTRTGMYCCVISPTGIQDPATSTLETDILLTARARTTNIASEPLEIEFLPSVYMERDIHLDAQHFTAELTIVGTERALAKIKVSPFDPNLLEISKAEKVDKQTIKYKVKLVDYHWKLNEYVEPLLVKVFSQLTDESVKVNVKVLNPEQFTGQDFGRGKSPLVSILYKYRHVIIIVISMLIIFIGTFYVYSLFVQPVIHVNVTPVRSLLSPNSTQAAQRNLGTPPRAIPGTSAQLVCPCNRPNCPHNMGQQPQFNSICGTSFANTSSNPMGSKDGVYGDPKSFCCTNPEMRRNRRFM